MASRSARSIISRFSISAAVSRMMSSRIISAKMSPLASTWEHKEIYSHFLIKGVLQFHKGTNKTTTTGTLGAVPRCKLHFLKWYVGNLMYRSWFKFKLLLHRALWCTGRYGLKLLNDCPMFYKAKCPQKLVLKVDQISYHKLFCNWCTYM